MTTNTTLYADPNADLLKSLQSIKPGQVIVYWSGPEMQRTTLGQNLAEQVRRLRDAGVLDTHLRRSGGKLEYIAVGRKKTMGDEIAARGAVTVVSKPLI